MERDKFAWQKELTELEKAMEKKNASLGIVGTGARTAIKKTASKLKSSSSSGNEKILSTPGLKTAKQSENYMIAAKAYIDKLIASGASKDKVANAIALALRERALNESEAAQLRKTYTPRGYQY